MTSGHDPFGPASNDPFGGGAPPPIYGGQPNVTPGYGPASGFPAGPGSAVPPYNTSAILAPVFGVIVPPAGVALGHLALSQIGRDHQRGRGAAISGLVIGYIMCVVLISAGLWWTSHSGSSTTSTATNTGTALPSAPASVSAPSVVTSVTQQGPAPRIKLDLATVPAGTCVQVQVRSTSSNDALDLYQALCRHTPGVYVVLARVGSAAQCSSEMAAAPPDRSFALCLNPY